MQKCTGKRSEKTLTLQTKQPKKYAASCDTWLQKLAPSGPNLLGATTEKQLDHEDLSGRGSTMASLHSNEVTVTLPTKNGNL